ncbi:MAG: hypothetical protein KKH28_00005, partial [Elusimicrobia bacterium]|nr:hypothetical protein [Elusimicrobiota bacterium]
PKYAFIQASATNNYGHPHQETLARLTAAGAKIYLTTGGTQSVTIPARGKDVPLPVEPIINEQPAMTAGAEQKYPEMTLTWNPDALENINSETLYQLKDLATAR